MQPSPHEPVYLAAQPRGLMAYLVSVALLPLALPLGIIVLLTARLQRALLFMNWVTWPCVPLSRPGKSGMSPRNTTHFFLKCLDGVRIGAWHIGSSSAPLNNASPTVSAENPKHQVSAALATASHVVLFLHGTASNRALSLRIQAYRSIKSISPNAHIVAIDYRGFGDSDNVLPSENGLYCDAITAFDFIVSSGVLPERIIVVGQSLGTAVAMRLACLRAPARLILVSPFTSIAEAGPENRDMAPLMYPMLTLLGPRRTWELLRWGLLDNFNTAALISGTPNKLLASPQILIIHGTQDRHVPCAHARTLFSLLVNHHTRQDPRGAPASVSSQSYGEEGARSMCRIQDPAAATAAAVPRALPLCEFVEVKGAHHQNIYDYDIALESMRPWLNFENASAGGGASGVAGKKKNAAAI